MLITYFLDRVQMKNDGAIFVDRTCDGRRVHMRKPATVTAVDDSHGNWPRTVNSRRTSPVDHTQRPALCIAL